MTQEEYKLPEELKSGDAEQLWEFVARSIEKFIQEQDLGGSAEEPLQLGFTFSYPCHQEYIDHGKLITWTKGFEIKGVEGEDAAAQLREAMEKKVGFLLDLLEARRLTVPESASEASGTYQRHHRCNACLCVRGSGDFLWNNLWYRL